MADQDQVVDLGAAADARFADGGAVDAGVGLNFDVVFENRGAGLQHLVPAAVLLLGEAEAIAADDRAILQDDAIADAAEFANHSVGMGEEMIADFRAAINGNKAV